MNHPCISLYYLKLIYWSTLIYCLLACHFGTSILTSITVFQTLPHHTCQPPLQHLNHLCTVCISLLSPLTFPPFIAPPRPLSFFTTPTFHAPYTIMLCFLLFHRPSPYAPPLSFYIHPSPHHPLSHIIYCQLELSFADKPKSSLSQDFILADVQRRGVVLVGHVTCQIPEYLNNTQNVRV